jgi:parallel beta-helix repeat protein
LFVCAVGLLAGVAHAATLNVGAGQTYTTIQSAINAAKDYDTVLVAPGTYTENIDFLGKWITVTSSGGAAVTIIDGSGKSAPAVTIESGGTHATTQGSPSFIGFTVQNGGSGNATTPTGGIYLNLSNGTISNNVITHNHCAGIWVLIPSSPPAVQNNEIDNTTDNYDCPTGGGSGIVVTHPQTGCVSCTTGPLILTGNTIQNNVQGGHEVQGGGGITILGGAAGAQIQNNTVYNNATVGIGGGIFLGYSDAEVVQNLVYGNQAVCGGAGIAIERTQYSAGNGTLLLANNTLANNTLTGGACTVTQAGNASQLLFADEGSATYPAVVINNIVSGASTQPSVACAFANDAAAGVRDTPVFDHNLFFNSGGAVLDTVSCTDPHALLSDLNADPQFVNPAVFNFQIAASSPAVDAGNNNALVLDNEPALFTVNTTTDFGGSPRLADATAKGYATVDIGAYEFAATADTPQTSVSLTVANVNGEFFLLTAPGGSSVDLIAYVTSPVGGSTGCLGPVSFLEDGASIGSVNIGAYTNTATLKGVFLAPGTHHFAASYGGQSPCSAGVSVPVIYLVSNYAPSLTLTSSLNPALLGQAVTFTATIASADPAQGGPISLTDGGAVLATLTPNGSGVATFMTSTLALGSHPMQASYAANATHNAASAGLTQYIVNGSIATTVALSSSENPAALGDTVTFTAAVASAAGIPTGSVQFAEGTTVYATVPLVAGYGSAQWSTSTLALGQHVITATFVPTGLYSGSVGSLTEFIAGATSTTLTISANGATVGTVPAKTPVTLTATVTSGGSPVVLGQVNFCDATAAFCTDIHLLGTAQLTAAGTATLRFIPGLGNHRYQAVFLGTRTSVTSVSNIPKLAVTGTNPTTTVLTASGSPGNYGLSATVSGAGDTQPTGSVSFLDTTNANYVLASASLAQGSRSIGFATVPSPATGKAPGYVTSGDFNGDGIPDLAAANTGDSSVTVLLGNGDGTFRSGVTLPTTDGSAAKWIAVADFNNDGRADLAVSNLAGSLSIYLGHGDGTFTATSSPATGAQPNAVVAADFNGDGNVDLAVANMGSASRPTVTLLLGKGDGTFAASTVQTGVLAYWLAAGDFNGDGIADLVIVDIKNVQVLLGNGDGTFAGLSPFFPDQVATGVVVADLNQDGSLDLALPILNGGAIGANLFLGNGDGTFTKASPPTLNGVSIALGAGDLNRDGFLDLAATQNNPQYVAIAFGNGKGVFKDVPVSPATGDNPMSMALADFDGDGTPDLAVANADDNNLTILLTRQTATVTVAGISPVGTGTHYAEASYSGDTYYAPSVSNLVPLVAQRVPTVLTLAVNPSSSIFGQQVSLTATLNPTLAQNHVASGTVTFFSNGIAVGSGNVANGVATLLITTLPAGTDLLLATYSGDTNFAPSSSVTDSYVVTLPPGFTISVDPLTLKSGQQGSTTIHLNSIGGFAGPISLSVGALPMYATAKISPASVTLAAGGTGASTLTLTTLQKKVENTVPPRPGSGPGSRDGRWPAVLAAALLLLLPYGGKRRARLLGSRLRVVVGLLWVGALVQGLTGCTNAYYTDLVVAPGSYPVTVTGTDQNGSQQSATLTVVITP